MAFLLRTASGAFTLSDAVSIAQLAERKANGTLETALTSCEDALAFLPRIDLAADRKKPALNGLETTFYDGPKGNVRLYADGAFLGIGCAENGSVRLTVNLFTE